MSYDAHRDNFDFRTVTYSIEGTDAEGREWMPAELYSANDYEASKAFERFIRNNRDWVEAELISHSPGSTRVVSVFKNGRTQGAHTSTSGRRGN